MFNRYKNTLVTLESAICKDKSKVKYYKSKVLTSADVYRNIYIHNGNSLVWRYNQHIFIGRNIKFNVLFKKPLVRPQKKKKK